MPELPAWPDLTRLRHQAKDLLRAANGGDPDALTRIGVVSERVTLASAQLAVAGDDRPERDEVESILAALGG